MELSLDLKGIARRRLRGVRSLRCKLASELGIRMVNQMPRTSSSRKSFSAIAGKLRGIPQIVIGDFGKSMALMLPTSEWLRKVVVGY